MVRALMARSGLAGSIADDASSCSAGSIPDDANVGAWDDYPEEDRICHEEMEERRIALKTETL